MDGSTVLKTKRLEFTAPWTHRRLREEVIYGFNLTWSKNLLFFSTDNKNEVDAKLYRTTTFHSLHESFPAAEAAIATSTARTATISNMIDRGCCRSL